MPILAGLNYFFHEAEDSMRLPLILVHGAGGFHLSWPPQVRRMPGQRVLAIDLPGHGKSSGLGRSSIEEYADDVFTFLNALRIDQAIIAGHSMGSAIALMIALKNPEHVPGLVLIGAGAKLRVSPAILEGVSSSNTFLSTVQLIADYSFGPDAPPHVKELSTQRMAETHQAVLRNDFLACDAFDVTDQLGKIKVPTLIICGGRDKMTPRRNSEFLRDGIANSRLEIVEDAGHMTMLEQPHKVTDLISRFLDEFPPRA